MVTAVEAINEYQKKLVSAAQQAMVTGMREFEALEIKTEMSGRPGLKRQSGSLAQGWHIKTEGEGLNYTATMANSPGTWYAIVHQNGATIRPKKGPYLHYKVDGQFRKSREVTIPKRLHIPENFETSGKEIIMKHLKVAVSGLHKA